MFVNMGPDQSDVLEVVVSCVHEVMCLLKPMLNDFRWKLRPCMKLHTHFKICVKQDFTALNSTVSKAVLDVLYQTKHVLNNYTYLYLP